MRITTRALDQIWANRHTILDNARRLNERDHQSCRAGVGTVVEVEDENIDDPFQYPNYGGIDERSSRNLGGDVVDFINDLAYDLDNPCWKNKRSFMRFMRDHCSVVESKRPTTKSRSPRRHESSLVWIGKVNRHGNLVPLPDDGFEGFPPADAEIALLDIQRLYPRTKLVKCRCVFEEILD